MEIKIWEASSTGGFEDIVEEISQKVRQRDGVKCQALWLKMNDLEIWMHESVCACACMHVYGYMYVCKCMCACTYECSNTCVGVCVRVCVSRERAGGVCV